MPSDHLRDPDGRLRVIVACAGCGEIGKPGDARWVVNRIIRPDHVAAYVLCPNCGRGKQAKRVAGWAWDARADTWVGILPPRSETA